MRTTARPEHKLGQILWDFRGQHHLSREDAAKVLGISIATIQSFEYGYDQKTYKPINPRTITIEALANRMHAYAAEQGKPYAGTARDLYHQLMAAAGKVASEQGGQRTASTKADDAAPGPTSEPFDPSIFQAKYPPTDEERRIANEAYALGITSGSLRMPDFWQWPPEERRRTFRNLENLIEEERRNLERMKRNG